MNVTIAIDSWKGCLDSLEAARAIEAGLRRVCPELEARLSPLADGGEGTTAALCTPEERITCTVTGPLGDPVQAEYGIRRATGTAVLEMASAAGLPLVPPDRRDPLHTTTRGVGELIADALERGCRNFLVGIGGSATNDGGAGMLAALGFGLLDTDGQPIPDGAAGLEQLCRIDTAGVRPELRNCRFRIACDVENPLCGPTGASAVYGPQKGAGPKVIPRLDAALRRFAEQAAAAFPGCDPDLPGCGAAGGLGFGFAAFLGAELRPGAAIVLEETGLAGLLPGSDLCFTGEGQFDCQTSMGKAPAAVARLARAHGVPVLALAGSVQPDAPLGKMNAVFPVLRTPMTLTEAMDPDTARRNIAAAAEQILRLWQAARR